jgi:N utilization substance protein B
MRSVGRRRKAREVALQFLYQLDVSGDVEPAAPAAEFWSRHPVDAQTRAFAEELVFGAKQNQGKIDALLAQSAEHWDLERMAAVDRNILRAAVYELLWHAEVPPKVAINEAIEIAKKFGTQESSRFINGVLDRIARELRPIC